MTTFAIFIRTHSLMHRADDNAEKVQVAACRLTKSRPRR